MNTQHKIILLHTAIELLQIKDISEQQGDAWGAEYFGSLANSIINGIQGTQPPVATPLSEDQCNAIIDQIFAPDTSSYTLKSDVIVNRDGQLQFTPEND